MPADRPFEDPASSRRIVVLIAVICFLFAGVWAYVFILQKPRVADGAIEKIAAAPLHTEIRVGGTMAEGVGGGVEKHDQMLVWVAMDMRNLTLEIPLFETNQRATLSFPDGEQFFAYAERPEEIEKLRRVPGALMVNGALLPREMTLSPKQSAAGLALFVFPVTKQQWETRREFSVAVSFQYQRDLALKEKTAAP